MRIPYALSGGSLQRLYSTFADGWPGTGLLLQRAVVAIMLLRLCVIHLLSFSFSASMFAHIIGACASILLLVGLWTPIAGTLIAMIELWVAFAHLSDPWLSIVLATIGGTSAMLGPGAFSVDARLFGRRHLEV